MIRKVLAAVVFGLLVETGSTVAQEGDGQTVATEVAAKTTKSSKQENTWKKLSKITFTKQYDELMGFKVDVPVFSEEIKAMENTDVTIRGYIIPVEGYKSHKEFIFSAYPYSMCFFCGGAGPETVMEVYSAEPVEYTAEQVTLRGKLELNADDINRLMYALHDAVILDAGDEPEE